MADSGVFRLYTVPINFNLIPLKNKAELSNPSSISLLLSSYGFYALLLSNYEVSSFEFWIPVVNTSHLLVPESIQFAGAIIIW